MTFVFHPLSNYNSIIEPFSIDFPSHFILSFIYIYTDTTTCDKFIFPSAIIWILCHFSVSSLEFTHFSAICAIDAATIRRSEAQLRLKQPRPETVTLPSSSTPSSSAASSAGGVTLEVVMAQLQRMDAHLNTLNDELC